MTSRDRMVILVRHARTLQEPEVPSELWKLDAGTEEDCLSLADELRPLAPATVITSTHQKAVRTGSLLAAALGLPVHTRPGLEEQDRTGVPFMHDPDEWFSTLQRLFRDQDELVLGRETGRQAADRFESAVRRELADQPGENLILVGHATAITLLVARHNGMDEAKAFAFWQSIGMPEAIVLNAQDFRLLKRILPARAGDVPRT